MELSIQIYYYILNQNRVRYYWITKNRLCGKILCKLMSPAGGDGVPVVALRSNHPAGSNIEFATSRFPPAFDIPKYIIILYYLVLLYFTINRSDNFLFKVPSTDGILVFKNDFIPSYYLFICQYFFRYYQSWYIMLKSCYFYLMCSQVFLILTDYQLPVGHYHNAISWFELILDYV